MPGAARQSCGRFSAVAQAVVGLWLAILPACQPAPLGSAIAWADDHDAALARAKALGQPVIVSFGADWCGACRRLRDEVWPTPSVRQAAARFATVHIDLTQADKTTMAQTKAYGIESLPTVVFIDSSGAVLDSPRLRTFLSPRALGKLLRSIR